jgi:hypothetical protein
LTEVAPVRTQTKARRKFNENEKTLVGLPTGKAGATGIAVMPPCGLTGDNANNPRIFAVFRQSDSSHTDRCGHS